MTQKLCIKDSHGNELKSKLFQAYHAYPAMCQAEMHSALKIQNAQKTGNRLVISYNINGCGHKS